MIIKTIWENNVEIFYTGNPRFFDNLFLELAIALRIQTSIARERAANASNAGHYGVISPPKFIVWILTSSFKFSVSTIQFHSSI